MFGVYETPSSIQLEKVFFSFALNYPIYFLQLPKNQKPDTLKCTVMNARFPS